MSKLFLGCDPDLHTCAFAIVREDFCIERVWVVRSEGSKEHAAVLGMIKALWNSDITPYPDPIRRMTAAAVEAQEIYLTGKGRTKNPRNILHLGHVSGAVLTRFDGFLEMAYFPLPNQWKGQVDKLTHHRRILTKAGIGPSYIFEKGGKNPYCGIQATGCSNIGDMDLSHGDWLHVTDAIGLAQYAAERYVTEMRKQELLSKVRGGV